MTDLEIYDQARAGFRAQIRAILDFHIPNGIVNATCAQLFGLIPDLQRLASPPVLEDASPKTEAEQKRSGSEI